MITHLLSLLIGLFLGFVVLLFCFLGFFFLKKYKQAGKQITFFQQQHLEWGWEATPTSSVHSQHESIRTNGFTYSLTSKILPAETGLAGSNFCVLFLFPTDVEDARMRRAFPSGNFRQAFLCKLQY